ncbi:hypothetical protein AAH978_00805 [Streptomyces sp. ZYX-F-203]
MWERTRTAERFARGCAAAVAAVAALMLAANAGPGHPTPPAPTQQVPPAGETDGHLLGGSTPDVG